MFKWMKLPAGDRVIDPERIQFIDITRGMLIYWMMVAHALSLSEVDSSSLLNYLRPRGWASSNFIILSGFSLAVVFLGRSLSGQVLKARLGKRALQLLAWAIATELLSRFFTGFLLASNEQFSLKALLDPFRTWSISAFLLPVFVLFGLASLLAPYLKSPPIIPYLGITFIATLLIGEHIIPLERMVASINEVLSIRTIFLTSFAFFGVGAGLLFKCFRMPIFLSCLGFIGITIVVLSYFYQFPAAIHIGATFCVTLSGCKLLQTIPKAGALKYILGLMGRSALLIFIAHRLVMQTIEKLAAHALKGSSLFFLLMLSTLFILISICYVKEHSPWMRASLKRVGL
jgi:hypothetical protein